MPIGYAPCDDAELELEEEELCEAQTPYEEEPEDSSQEDSDESGTGEFVIAWVGYANRRYMTVCRTWVCTFDNWSLLGGICKSQVYDIVWNPGSYP